MSSSGVFWRRALELVIVVLLALLLAPVYATVAALVRIVMGRPVLFQQWRPGLKGRPFRLLKFRTMRDARDHGGQLLPDSKRLTCLGQFLRRTSLDELPELLSVLKGDMSLVGPRPLLMKYLPLYSPEQMRRHDVKPGITGWAQVNGRNALTWEEKFALDVWYVDHQSLQLDIKIFLLTILRILAREGINHPGHATMREFMGE